MVPSSIKIALFLEDKHRKKLSPLLPINKLVDKLLPLNKLADKITPNQ